MLNDPFIKQILNHTIFKFIRDTEQYISFNSENHSDVIDTDSKHLKENILIDLRNLNTSGQNAHLDSENFLNALLDELHSNHKDMYFQIINRLKYAFVFEVEDIPGISMADLKNMEHMLASSKIHRNSMYGSFFDTHRTSYNISYKEILTRILNVYLKDVSEPDNGYGVSLFNTGYSLNNIFKYNTTSMVGALLYPAMYYDTRGYIYPAKIDPYKDNAPSLSFGKISDHYTKHETLYNGIPVHVMHKRHIYYASSSSSPNIEKQTHYSFKVTPMKKGNNSMAIEKLFDSNSAIVRNT